MATVRIVKKNKKHKLSSVGKLLVLFVVVGLTYFASQTMLRAYNVTLQKEKEQLTVEKGNVEDQVNILETEVQALSQPERIQDVAKEAGLENNSENVVNLPSE